MEHEHSGRYVLLVNMHATVSSQNSVVRLRKMMIERKLVRGPGCNCIEIDGHVHRFLADTEDQATCQLQCCFSVAGTQMGYAGSVLDKQLTDPNAQ
ncbi:E motif [Dillenia turbinata]|uniref:E motif n=1 Tax=Dillenia turbinata TaxID=194707 RepID=A0AAN8Z7H4_9MAGN